MSSREISSIESTTTCPSSTGYFPPTFTCGRSQMRTLQRILPRRTPSRNRFVKTIVSARKPAGSVQRCGQLHAGDALGKMLHGGGELFRLREVRRVIGFEFDDDVALVLTDHAALKGFRNRAIVRAEDVEARNIVDRAFGNRHRRPQRRERLRPL